MGKVIAVFGQGEANAVSFKSQLRIEAAVTRYLELESAGISVSALVFMAGVGRDSSRLTLATRMAYCAREYLEKMGVTKKVRLVYNRDERSVWGTIREMQWAQKEVSSRFPDAEIKYVTNERHGERVIKIAEMLRHPQPRIVTSDDEPPPVYHEMFANWSLTAHKWGFHRPVQFFRRTVYSGG